MDCSELQKFVPRQPSLRNLTQVDYGKPKAQQNKVGHAKRVPINHAPAAPASV